MSRIRTIKPDFWKHEELSELPEATHLLAASLLNYADDEGYFNANPKLVRAECCPLREPSVSVHDSLNQLAAIGYVRLGIGGDGKRYGQVSKFLEHQRVNRPVASKIKELGIVWDTSLTNHSQLIEPSSPEGNGREGNGKGMEHTVRSGDRTASGPIEKSEEEAIDEELDDIPHSIDRRRYPEAFDALWLEYRPIASPNASKHKSLRAWERLSVADREACWSGLVDYVIWLQNERKKRTDHPAKHLATFINERGWEPFAENAA